MDSTAARSARPKPRGGERWAHSRATRHTQNEQEGIESRGRRTAEEVGLKLPPIGLVSPAKVAKQVVRAIRNDEAELVVLPGPGKIMRAIMDRFPGIGPSMNRITGANKTMQRVSEYREREAHLAEARPDGNHAGQERSAHDVADPAPDGVPPSPPIRELSRDHQ